MWVIRAPITNPAHHGFLKKWMTSVGIDTSRTFAGKDCVDEYAKHLAECFGPSRYQLHPSQYIKIQGTLPNGYPGSSKVVMEDDAETFLWGKEVTIVVGINEDDGDECAADDYIEEDGIFYCNYEGCDKSLKTERGIITHIKKVHG